jgi:hypothetical protein
MKKLICLSLFTLVIGSTAMAQAGTATTKEAKAMDETRLVLADKLQLTAAVIEKVIPIENEFHAAVASVGANANLSSKEKQMKVSAAHVLRREKLMAVPLTGREMEDVIEVVETIRRKHKL